MMNLFSKSLKFSGNYLNSPTSNSVNSYNSNEAIFMHDVSRLMAQARNAWINFGVSVIDFFKSYKFKELVFTLKTISFILTLILLAIIIYVFIKSNSLNVAKTAIVNKKSVFKKKKTQKKWIKIEKRFNSGIEANYKLAILEADNFYDESLKILGYDSEKNLGNVDEIKKARKIKNRLVEDSGFILTTEDTKNSLDAYKKGLEELNVI